MKPLLIAIPILALSSSQTLAETAMSTNISVVLYRCLDPKEQQDCYATDKKSKTTSCPGCKSWEEVSVEADVAFNAGSSYSQPKLFVDDASKQMYGIPLSGNDEGSSISVAQLYANPGKYGWVEIKGEQSKEGTIAVLPHTAGVVINQESPEDITVLYSSTKSRGAVRKTNLDNLTVRGAKPKYLIPMEFVTRILKILRIQRTPPP